MQQKIRPITKSDVPNLKKVLDSCGLFPSEYLDDMIADYFNNESSEDIWFTCSEDDQALSIGYCVPEKLTVGTYNVLAIGVSEQHQRKGIAEKMMHYIEQVLKEKEARILIVETSSDSAQTAARTFYKKIGYQQMATIKDFWNDGEDKIVFWKRL